jgi:hypothetical protein
MLISAKGAVTLDRVELGDSGADSDSDRFWGLACCFADGPDL